MGTIRNNYVSGATANGIYINTGANNVQAYNNLVINSVTNGIHFFAGATGGSSYNNTLVNNGTGIKADYAGCTGTIIANNIVYLRSNNQIGIVLDSSSISGSSTCNNCVYKSPSLTSCYFGVWAGTYCSTYTAWLAQNTTDTHSLTIDPLFSNANGTTVDDFKLQNTSACKFQGADLSAIFTTDSFGTTRDAKWDMGFYESADIPAVTSVAPATVGNLSSGVVTIYGAGFFGSVGSNSVISAVLDDTNSTALTISGAEVSDTVISGVVVPAGITFGTYNIKVTSTLGTNLTSAQKLIVSTLPPMVSVLSPSTGSNFGPNTIAITGSGFFGGGQSSLVNTVGLDDPGSTAISSYSVVSNTLITNAIIPSGIVAGTYNVIVTGSNGSNTISAQKFVVATTLPSVSSISPSAGENYSSTTINITGAAFFGGLQTSSVVSVNLNDENDTALTSFSVESDSSITGAVIPAGLVSGVYDVIVTTYGGKNSSSLLKFAVNTNPPLVSGVDPSSCSNLNTSTVSIYGQNFFGGTGTSNVSSILLDSYPEVALSFSSSGVSDTSISGVTFPSGKKAGTYNVMVTTAGGTNETSAQKLVITTPAPEVSAISPSSMDNMSPVTVNITGNHFFGGLTSSNVCDVMLDSYPQQTALKLTNAVITNTFITGAVVPARVKPGTYNVRVRNSGGVNATSSQSFVVTQQEYSSSAVKIDSSNHYFNYNGTNLNPGATGYSSSRKMAVLSNGSIAAFYVQSYTAVYSISTDNGNSWGTPVTICSTTPRINIWKEANDNIYIVYMNNTVLFRKLTYNSSNNTYSIGAEKVVESSTVNPEACGVVKDSNGRIWISYNGYDAVGHSWPSIRYSDDEGVNWSAMTCFTDRPMAPYRPLLLIDSDGKPASVVRPYADFIFKKWNGSAWLGAESLLSIAPRDNGSFAAITFGNSIHVVSATTGGIKHKKRTNGTWDTSFAQLSFNGSDIDPALIVNGDTLYCFWSAYSQSKCEYDIVYSKWTAESGWDNTPTLFYSSSDARILDKVFVCHAGSYEDLTTAANDDSTDVLHSATNATVKYAGDFVVFGSNEKFNRLFEDLAVMGVNGALTWSYSKGNGTWQAVTPKNQVGGAVNNLTATQVMYFWDNASSLPSDWVQDQVNGETKYWMKAEVATAYSTAPMAFSFKIDQKKATCLNTALNSASAIPIMWTEWDTTFSTRAMAKVMSDRIFIAPTVTGVTPSSGSNLGQVTVNISGTGFFGALSTSQVSAVKLDTAPTETTIDLTGATITDTGISGAVIPAQIKAGTYNIKVTSRGKTNQTSTQKYIVQSGIPEVSGVIPGSAQNSSSTTVTITGTNFFGGTGAPNVIIIRLDSEPEAVVLYNNAVITDTTIEGAVIPAQVRAGTYNVKVATSSGSNTTSSQVFISTTPAPVLSSVNPGTVANSSATVITLTGTGFTGGTAGSDLRSILVDTNPVTFIETANAVITDNQISGAIVPAGIQLAGSYNVKVITGGGESGALPIQVAASVPSVSVVAPSTGSNSALNTISIFGYGFCGGTNTADVISVHLDDPSAAALNITNAVIDDTSITGVEIPSGIKAGSYNVRVTVTAGTNTVSAQKYVVTTSGPTVSALSPNTSPNSDLLTLSITGSGFFGGTTGSDVSGIALDTSPYATEVLSFSVSSDSEIGGVIIPTGMRAGTYNMKVTTGGGTNTASTQKFIVTAGVPIVVFHRVPDQVLCHWRYLSQEAVSMEERVYLMSRQLSLIPHLKRYWIFHTR